jgi:hypothetical protein
MQKTNLLDQKCFQSLLIHFWKTPSVLQRKKKSNTCTNCWVTSNWWLLFSTEVLIMGGLKKTTNQDMTGRSQLFSYLKSKMVIVSVDIKWISCHLLVEFKIRCCLTYLASVTSLIKSNLFLKYVIRPEQLLFLVNGS